jgi:hypothetical protein
LRSEHYFELFLFLHCFAQYLLELLHSLSEFNHLPHLLFLKHFYLVLFHLFIRGFFPFFLNFNQIFLLSIFMIFLPQ